MAKLSKPLIGVKNGDIYPTQFTKGDECPEELEAAAIALGALSENGKATLSKAEAAAAAKLAAEEEAAKKAAEEAAQKQESQK